MMRLLQIFCFLLFFSMVGVACNFESAPPLPIYETVTEASLKPGDPLPAPTGKVILTVAGKIKLTNAAGETGERRAEFDLEMLERLGLVKYDV